MAIPDQKNPPPPSVASLSLFISLNGSLASKGQTVGGGDMVLFKFIRLSNTHPDVLIPKCAQDFVATQGRLFLTVSHRQLTLFGILTAFFIRTLQGLWRAFQNQRVYDVALAASPF